MRFLSVIATGFMVALFNINPAWAQHDASAPELETLNLRETREQLQGMDRKQRHQWFKKAKDRYKRFSPEEKAAFRKEIKSQLAHGGKTPEPAQNPGN